MKKEVELLFKDLPKTVKSHIKHLERVRRDFIANVSHELRTPLTVIHGYLEVLLNTKRTAHPWKKIFTQMYQHSIRMERIIDDLLLLSRLENEDRQVEIKQINVSKLLELLYSDAIIISGNKNQDITLNVNKDIFIDGSEEELKSLFSNLIINAVKYTTNKGKINIEWYEENGSAVFKVSDNGIGISTEHMPRITERFYRVDKGRSRESGGTGLGLAIVKHVLVNHQGKLLIESKLGKGSIFTCIFPPQITSMMKSKRG